MPTWRESVLRRVKAVSVEAVYSLEAFTPSMTVDNHLNAQQDHATRYLHGKEPKKHPSGLQNLVATSSEHLIGMATLMFKLTLKPDAVIPYISGILEQARNSTSFSFKKIMTSFVKIQSL